VGARLDQLTREEECERLLQTYSNDFHRLSVALDRQFRILHDRAQVVLGICGILISANVLVVTGRIIVRASLDHRRALGYLLAGAGSFEIISAAVVVGSVLRVRWISRPPGTELRSWVLTNLAYRDAKTRSYRLAVLLVLLAMLAYQVTVAIAIVQL
jgi:hypothetical protein